MRTPKSKKWARRRKVTLTIRCDNGWHKRIKIPRTDWESIERALLYTGETLQEFFTRSLEEKIAKTLGNN